LPNSGNREGEGPHSEKDGDVKCRKYALSEATREERAWLAGAGNIAGARGKKAMKMTLS